MLALGTVNVAPASAATLAPGYGAGEGFCKSVSTSAYKLGASFRGVYACGPSTGYGDPFDPYPYAFQCVELVNRFEWAVYGKAIVYANGAGVVQKLHDQDHVPISGPAPGVLPAPGDVISMSSPADRVVGHVAVVTAVDAPRGSGTITVMEQNASTTGSSTITVKNWVLSYRGLFDTFQWTMQGRRHADSPVLLRHTGSGGYNVAPDGAISSIAGAPALAPSATWPGHDIVRGAVLRPDDQGGYVLDLFGGLHPFGNAPAVSGTAYWPGWDIARGLVLRSNGVSGYVLDGYGGLHAFGGAPALSGSAYWPGWDIANGIAGYDDGGGYVLDGYGGLHAFGDAPQVAVSAYWPGWNIASAVVTTRNRYGRGGYVLDGFGGFHPFGDAPSVSSSTYHAGRDTAVSVGLTADGTTGYQVDTQGTLTAVTAPSSTCTTCV